MQCKDACAIGVAELDNQHKTPIEYLTGREPASWPVRQAPKRI